MSAYKVESSSSIISYELPWNHINFSTKMFIRCKKEYMLKKMELLSCYKSQVEKQRGYFSKEFIMGLAKTRGVQINSDFAEAFEVIRWIQ